jgi:subtilisin family serine protease
MGLYCKCWDFYRLALAVAGWLLALMMTGTVLAAPKLALPRSLEVGETRVTLVGTNLDQVRQVWLNQTLLTLQQRSATSLQVSLPENLLPGEYPLRFLATDNKETSVSTGLLVLPRLSGGSRGPIDGEPLDVGAITVAFAPAQRDTLQAIWERAGLSLDFEQAPAITNSSGICGKTIASFHGKTAKTQTFTALNNLVDTLVKEEFGGQVRISARFVIRGPASGSNTNQIPMVHAQAALPNPVLAQSSKPSISVGVLDNEIKPAAILTTGIGFLQADGRNFAFAVNTTEGNQVITASPDPTVTEHGTNVALLLAQVASKRQIPLQLVPLQACDRQGFCRNASLVAAICHAASLANRADAPLRVLNISLSGEIHDPLVYEALSEAASRGVTIVIAAGNGRRESGTVTVEQTLGFPARYASDFVDVAGRTFKAIPGLLAVGAVGLDGQGYKPSIFSVAGNWISLVAPGEGLKLTSDNNQETSLTGTSYAAPQIAALAADLLLQNPLLRPQAVKVALQKQAQSLPGCNQDRCGAGLLAPAR